MTGKHVKELLEEKYLFYSTPQFIATDPISVPHRFSRKEDIEISGFLAATIAWGQRPTIIKNALRLMELMEWSPYEFVVTHEEKDLERFRDFVHRTFNSDDLIAFIGALKNLYQNHGGLEGAFAMQQDERNTREAISRFRSKFLGSPHLPRTRKHVSDPCSNSACKRLNMFLRWMVRSDKEGIDFGLWKGFSPAFLSCPLDVHSGNTARKLGLIQRKQNDWKTVEELDCALRSIDPLDPTRFDLALFGIGVFEKFA